VKSGEKDLKNAGKVCNLADVFFILYIYYIFGVIENGLKN